MLAIAYAGKTSKEVATVFINTGSRISNLRVDYSTSILDIAGRSERFNMDLNKLPGLSERIKNELSEIYRRIQENEGVD